jgi:hypothetical protein
MCLEKVLAHGIDLRLIKPEDTGGLGTLGEWKRRKYV